MKSNIELITERLRNELNDLKLQREDLDEKILKVRSEIERYGNTPVADLVFLPVVFEGIHYHGIQYFDGIKIGLYTEKTLKGTFDTNIAISEKEFRDKSPTKAKVEIEYKGDWAIFKICDDWGVCSTIELHNSLVEEIEFAKNSIVEEGLFVETKKV